MKTLHQYLQLYSITLHSDHIGQHLHIIRTNELEVIEQDIDFDWDDENNPTRQLLINTASISGGWVE